MVDWGTNGERALLGAAGGRLGLVLALKSKSVEESRRGERADAPSAGAYNSE